MAALRRLEAWLSLPAGDKADLLGGRIIYRALPSLELGDTILGIAEQFGRLRGPLTDGGGGWWLGVEPDLYLCGEGLRPDFAGWRIENHLAPPRKVNVGDKGLGVYMAAPDWVCEVFSGSTRAHGEDERLKWRTYHEAGVGHYWIVDLTREQLTVYRRGERSYEPVEVAGREAVKALPPFESIEFQAKRVFMMSGLI